MKKLIVILVLLIFNFCIVYAKMIDKKLEKVDIKLKKEELGIVVINLNNSNSLLLKYEDKYILYLIDYVADNNIENSKMIFTDYVDYIYMNNYYNYKEDKVFIAKAKTIGKLTLMRNKILYKKQTICINQSNGCDFVFLTHNDILLTKTNKAVFYDNTLSETYIDYIKNFWLDKYPLSKQSYTVITIGDEYKVTNLVK